jgi:hypothetical protein
MIAELRLFRSLRSWLWMVVEKLILLVVCPPSPLLFSFRMLDGIDGSLALPCKGVS